MTGVYDPNTGELTGGALSFGSAGVDRLDRFTPEERELLRLNGEFRRADGTLVRIIDFAVTTWRDGRMI